MAPVDLDPKYIADRIANLVIQRVCDKAWLYWPPGPMTRQVFDTKRCKEEIETLVTRLLADTLL